MTRETVELRPEQCVDAESIQAAIDDMAGSEGVINLPEMDLTLDRGLEIYSGIHLHGMGERTVLRKGPSRIYPLTGYHNYGMKDVPLKHSDGLRAGMTVSVLDDKRGGFYSTFARITWIDDGWVGLDHGIEADYAAAENPRLVTAYPLIFGHRIRDGGVHEMVLDGNLAGNPDCMDGCRGGAVYFANSDEIDIDGVCESGYNGEGLSFQMCTNVTIRGSSFCDNTGNGMHPGAGSTSVYFEKCRADENRKSGFYFCVRANHISVRECTFSKNVNSGISVGTRDCHNLIEDCDIIDNDGPGIRLRKAPIPIEVHSCTIRKCRLSGNAHESGEGQIEINADAHDIVIENTRIDGNRMKPGVFAETETERIFLDNNQYKDCSTERIGDAYSDLKPIYESGCENIRQAYIRHLKREQS